MKVGILGGTGSMGHGLALQLSGRNEVRIGSRTAEKATAAASLIPGVKGDKDEAVAEWCEVAILAIPFDAVGSLGAFAKSLSGKLVISIINPLKMEGDVLQYGLEEGSAAETVASVLTGSRVATALNNVPVSFLLKPSEQEMDILVAADSRRTYDEAAALIGSISRMRPLYVGPLSQAQSVERLTVMVLNASKLNGGTRFTVKFVA